MAQIPRDDHGSLSLERALKNSVIGTVPENANLSLRLNELGYLREEDRDSCQLFLISTELVRQH
jgi:hypothetical protein